MLNELANTPVTVHMAEHVVILSDEPNQPLLTEVPEGLERPIRVASSTEVAQVFHVESGPWLIVLEHTEKGLLAAYSGGYTNGQLSPLNRSRFAEIRSSILNNKTQTVHKGFGCSVGRNVNTAKTIFEAKKVRRFIQSTFGIKI